METDTFLAKTLILVFILFPVFGFTYEEEQLEDFSELYMEPSINIKDSSEIESYETVHGEIFYKTSFFGKQVCVFIVPANPLRSLDYDKTYTYPCD